MIEKETCPLHPKRVVMRTHLCSDCWREIAAWLANRSECDITTRVREYIAYRRGEQDFPGIGEMMRRRTRKGE